MECIYTENILKNFYKSHIPMIADGFYANSDNLLRVKDHSELSRPLIMNFSRASEIKFDLWNINKHKYEEASFW